MKNLKLEEGKKQYFKDLKEGKVKTLDPLEKAKANPKSLRYAINAKCYDCCCYDKVEVKLCTAKDCPLYGLRPYQSKKK